MKDYKKDFNDKLEDGSFCDGELISIANGYITEMQNIITELEKDKQYFSDNLDKQVEATLKLHKEYQELEQKNHEILKNSLDISNRFDELEEKLANADYQLEGRDLKIKELEIQNEKMKKYAKLLQDICVVMGNDPYMVFVGLKNRVEILWDKEDEPRGYEMADNILNRLLAIKPHEWVEIDKMEIKEND
jgi:hypothetical protein